MTRNFVFDDESLSFSLEEKDQKNRAGRTFAKKYGAEKSRENQAAPSHIPPGLVVFFAQKPIADFPTPYF